MFVKKNMKSDIGGWRTTERLWKPYLNESDIVKVEFDELELELQLGPDDPEIDVRYILMSAR